MVKLKTGPALFFSLFIVVLLLVTAVFIFFGFCPSANYSSIRNWATISAFLGLLGLLSPPVFFIIFSILTRKWKFLGTVILTYLIGVGSIYLAVYADKKIHDIQNYYRHQSTLGEKKECPPNKIHSSGDLGCISCDTSWAFAATAEECSKCPDRELKGDKCVLKVCPPDYPLRDSRNLSCNSCSFWAPDISKWDCAMCENLEMEKGYCLPRTGTTERLEKGNGLEIPYVNGKIHGTIKTYDKDENLIRTEEMYSGMKHGITKTFNTKGEIIRVMPYKNDFLNGKVEYYPTHDGKPEQPFGVKQVTDYEAGSREGLSLVYHANGKIRQETQYKNNKENGYDRLYDTQGNILMDSTFKDGKMIESYCFWKDGRKRKLTPTELKQYAAGYIVEACDE